MMGYYDLTPHFHSSLNLDRWSDLLEGIGHMEKIYVPPYNIEKIDEHGYLVTVSVPGFDEDELTVKTGNQTLRVTGKRSKPEETEEKTRPGQGQVFVHRGIVERSFELQLSLANHVRVEQAELSRGFLRISLLQELPEALKPQIIRIGTAKPKAKATETVEAASN